MITRSVYREDHEMFRATVRRFLERECLPRQAEWDAAGCVDRDTWLKAGKEGLLCTSLPEEYGGGGGDFLHSCIVIEELAKVGATGPAFPLHNEIVAPYILHYASEAQKRRWLPRMAKGEAIGAIAMTEPAAGSDLQGIKTTAIADGNHLVVNGQKVFITNGQNADLVIVVCKTDPAEGAKGVSLVLVEGDRDGFSRGRNLEKVGYKAQDTSELFFADVRVPASNMLGEAGQGFRYLMEQLPQERLVVAVRSAEVIETAVRQTVEYTRQRKAFGRAIADFQNTRFKLAEAKTEATVCRTFVDHCVALHLRRALDNATASMCKLHATETACRVLDECVQLHGGYGYMWEFPVARAWADARVNRIAGGTSEIMKEIISRAL
jgi:acyl-CoA dehydrogenase